MEQDSYLNVRRCSAIKILAFSLTVQAIPWKQADALDSKKSVSANRWLPYWRGKSD